ncbi:MAG: FkbM family methyltransferase [Candidatus Omnitrophica bacterium]|nr:FkbM family methyltransferase [Candidatus Omnitrophota bacterium]
MGKSSCDFKVCKNFWDYYILKWGFKKKINLILNTQPDRIFFKVNRNQLTYNKGLFKVIFNLIREKRLEYYKEKDKMIVYNKTRDIRKESNLDIFALETIKELLDNQIKFSDYDNDFFLVEIDKITKFFIRKRFISDWQILRESFRDNQYSLIYPYLKDSFVLDIGAYIGDTAVLFCNKGARKVYAYEPHPLFFEVCKKNIDLNNLNNSIEVFNFGVGDKEGIVEIKEDSFYGPGGTFGYKQTNQAKTISLRIVSFFKLIENMERIDILKMDCEGAEFPAIFSCPTETLKKIKIILIEYHKDPAPLIEHLNNSGFKVKIENWTRSAFSITGILFAINSNHYNF